MSGMVVCNKQQSIKSNMSNFDTFSRAAGTAAVGPKEGMFNHKILKVINKSISNYPNYTAA